MCTESQNPVEGVARGHCSMVDESMPANRRDMIEGDWVSLVVRDKEREGERRATPSPVNSDCSFWFSANKAAGLPSAAAPQWTVRPYILWGYRDALSWRECFRSLLYCHNETGNVWTHIVGFIYFFALLVNEITISDKDAHHKFVACAYLCAALFCMASSSLFHLFTPHSSVVYERALRIDMTGIALVIIASFGVGLHYGYWCHPTLGTIYITIVSILSVAALAWPHMPALLHNFNLSVGFFASFVAFALVPLFHWFFLVGGFGSEQVNLFFYKLLTTFGLYALGFAFYGAQFPERHYVGKVDIVGHSHQIWHLCVVAGAAQFWIAMDAYSAYRDTHLCVLS